MAINGNYLKVSKREEANLDANYLGVLERGMAMVAGVATASGEATVIPATGVGGEVFRGFLHLSTLDQASVPDIEILEIPALAPLTVSLRKAPIDVSNIRAIRTDTLAAITVVAGAPGAGELGFVGNVLTGSAALAGLELKITYRYTITARELARRAGQKSSNTGQERAFDRVTLLAGNFEVPTSNFNVAAVFVADDPVTLAAGGTVTVGGAGTVIGTCVQTPKVIDIGGMNQAYVTVKGSTP